jgi:hypothetical protein
MMRYFYVNVATPWGAGSKYIRAEKHPFHPETELAIQEEVARGITRQAGGQLIKPEVVSLVSAFELEEEVARARWPKDFEPMTAERLQLLADRHDCSDPTCPSADLHCDD